MGHAANLRTDVPRLIQVRSLAYWNPYQTLEIPFIPLDTLLILFAHILALLIKPTEAGNMLRGNGALHAMLDARARARVRLVLVTRMSFCLISKLLIQDYSSIPLVAPLCVLN